MMAFWEENHYFGPEGAHKIALASAVIDNRMMRFADWTNTHMPPS